MDLHLDEELLTYYNYDVFAKAAVSSMYDAVHAADENHYEKLFSTKGILLEKHPHNAVVKNSLKFMLHKLPPLDITARVKKRKEDFIKKLHDANKEMAKVAAKKIRPGSTVFVHSINNTVFELLKHAATYKDMTVHVLEHSPLDLGKHFKTHASDHVELKVFPDLAVRNALHGADVCFIGADAVTDQGSVVKLGGTAVATLAKKFNLPVYVLHHAYKYDADASKALLETEHEHELDYKQLHEFLDNEHVYAYVCEYGIFPPQHLKRELRFHNEWMFL